MKLLQVDTIEEAIQKLHCTVPRSWRKIERCELHTSCGLVLAEDLYASRSVPEFRRSTVDGYAIKASDSWGASTSMPVMLTLLGEVMMGSTATQKMQSGSCVYVPTGGMIPDAATAMVMVEHTEVLGEDTVLVYASAAEGNHIVEVGEDITRDELLISTGTRIKPRHLASIAAIGRATIQVYVPLRVIIISTGDEVITPGTELSAGEVYDINSFGLMGICLQEDMELVEVMVVKDNEEQLRSIVTEAKTKCDLVLISGGSSQGLKDVTEKVISHVSTPGVLSHGLAAKPGKPTIIGYDEISSTMLIGLPGHPVAAMVIYQVVILRFLKEQIQEKTTQVSIHAKLTKNCPSAAGRATIQLVELSQEAHEYKAEPIFGKSGAIKTLLRANGYFVMDVNEEGTQAGQYVEVNLF